MDGPLYPSSFFFLNFFSMFVAPDDLTVSMLCCVYGATNSEGVVEAVCVFGYFTEATSLDESLILRLFDISSGSVFSEGFYSCFLGFAYCGSLLSGCFYLLCILFSQAND